MWERNIILRERHIKLRGEKYCVGKGYYFEKRNNILRERKRNSWKRNTFREHAISMCIACSLPGSVGTCIKEVSTDISFLRVCFWTF